MQLEQQNRAKPNSEGWLRVIGLGPGDPALLAPAARAALIEAEDIIGYRTYLQLAGPFRDDQRVHDSDNRVELERARHAFQLAAAGRRVVVVSSGDPGVFAMATAVMEALEHAEDPAWGMVDLQIIPGISAAQAAAARIGAPLGHDFCTLSLSDNLKPWSVIARRLQLAAAADLVIALYNPSSRARPHQFSEALTLLREHRTPETPVILGRSIGRTDEQVIVTTLAEVDPEQVDMRTIIIIGSSQTRIIEAAEGRRWVYTPRWYPEAGQTHHL
ncbi:precorrin-3B C(17)-methyltransferase [Lamprobacter modestohalophilus]|uniref:precorrin-3B C(17)-methyltransferase n=1 Tax=Lamprobacter modestohalophilus TaxID=1064514 RepID=UPI002ADEB453|nr:precorrin-3B C(17)-methyltransferase [Lamprobacter modestohalophilus]MEA1051723.1 precorrin-3B C(17)-methyltransferase [Lamprobacter modestohalophilus]